MLIFNVIGEENMYFPREIVKNANIIVYEGAYGIDKYNNYFKAPPEKVKEFVDISSRSDTNSSDILQWIEDNKHYFTPMTKQEILIYTQGKIDGISIKGYEERPFNYPGGLGYKPPGSKND